MQLPHPVVLLGVPFHPITLDECIDWISYRISHRESHPPGMMATANLDFATQASQDIELQEILLQSDCVVCDGMPLVWASRWVGSPVPERVAGSDMVWKLFERGTTEGWKFYFLGSEESTLQSLQEKLATDYPGIEIVGSFAPPFGSIHDLDNEAIVAHLKQTTPDILLVAMGCPKQEKWISMHYREAGIPMSVGIGASLDFVVGNFRRAPVWMQKTGLEWLYRLLQEPKRMFRRYFIDFLYFVAAARKQKKALARFKKPKTEASLAYVRTTRPCNTSLIHLPARLDAAALQANKVPKVKPTKKTPNAIYDCADVTFADSTGIGFLTRMHKECASAGGSLVLFQPTQSLTKLIQSVHLDRVFRVISSRDELNEFTESMSNLSAATWGDRGEIDFTIRRDLRAEGADESFSQISGIWEANPEAKGIRLNLTEVGFMDSTGLGCLIRLFKMVQTRGGRLILESPNDNILNVLRLSKLDSIFEISHSTSETP